MSSLLCSHGMPAVHFDVERPADASLIFSESCETCEAELLADLEIGAAAFGKRTDPLNAANAD